jgi:hypothetical protein
VGSGRRARTVVVGVLLAPLLVACNAKAPVKAAADVSPAPTPASGAAPWPLPAPERVLGLISGAGLAAEPKESLQHHVHAHLDVYVNGKSQIVPGGIGIVITDPAVNSGTVNGAPSYGGIKLCQQPCISPLHTHDATGVIHTESLTNVDNTLGEFFKEWDVRLDGQCVGGYCEPAAPIAVYVDGSVVSLDRAGDIRLTDRKEIAIVIGTTPSQIPSTVNF